ncbi:MAG: hypothetical protein AB8E15_03060 [Bdellovibrionales bacterium]
MKISFGLLFIAFLVGCSSGQCRRKNVDNFFAEKTKDLPQFQKAKTAETGLGEGATVWVKVFKPDGSLQCGMGKPISPEDMQAALDKEGIRVKSAVKQNDGLMRIQVCGSATGMINVFEIQETNLKRSDKLGFDKLK